MLITHLLLILDVWDGKPTYRKSCAGNLLVCSDLTLGPSFKVKRGQLNLKVLITRLLLVLEVLVHCLYGGYNLHRFSDALGLVFNSSSAYCVTGETVKTTSDQRNLSIVGRDKIYFFKEKKKKCNLFIYLMNPDNNKV